MAAPAPVIVAGQQITNEDRTSSAQMLIYFLAVQRKIQELESRIGALENP